MEIVKEFFIMERRPGFSRFGYYNETCFIYHREDGPALIFSDGEMHWYIHDRLHREDGPAVINDSNGIEDWYYDDNYIAGNAVEWLKDHNIDDWKTMSDEDKFALSFYMRSLH